MSPVIDKPHIQPVKGEWYTIETSMGIERAEYKRTLAGLGVHELWANGRESSARLCYPHQVHEMQAGDLSAGSQDRLANHMLNR